MVYKSAKILFILQNFFYLTKEVYQLVVITY